MSALDQLLLLALLGAATALLAGNRRGAGWVLTLLYLLQCLMLVRMGGLGYAPGQVDSSVGFTVFGQSLHWRLDSLGWFFAVITLGSLLLSSWFAAGPWAQRYRQQGGDLRGLYGALALNGLSMLLLLASGDLLSLFIGWELVSWASFMLMAQGSANAVRYALRYVTYAIGGAMAVLAGLVILHSHSGSFEFAALREVLPQLPVATVWVLLLLFLGGFGTKMALLPLHLWQARAYAETPGPGAAFLGAISSRMGLFAIIQVLVLGYGMLRIGDMHLPYIPLDAADLIAWLSVFTIILPTFTALKQNDARRLLAWHGIGQGGYMLVGLMLADDLGSAGGLMHVFNHATYQAMLFMSVTAIVYRTGTSNLNELGGLVTRMPLSFVAMLVGIIGLAGLPPMNGFVSKWLVYRSMLEQGMPLLFVAAVIGTLGTILSVYKLIHNSFLGQLRLEHRDVPEAPWSMTLPMLVLAAIVFFTGWFPGLVLDWVASVQATVGLPVLAHHLGGVAQAKGGLDMIWVVGILLAGIGVGALIFLAGGRSKRVHQLDNYAGGHFLTADTRYHYSDNFYAGLMNLVGSWYRYSFQWLEDAVIAATDSLALVANGLYRYFHPSLLLLATVVLALGWVS